MKEHSSRRRALQLLSRAADGSLRDAVSLTDGAIASVRRAGFDAER